MLDIWVVEQRLGGGGMGTVYRCHNRAARRIQAAIKVLDPRFSSSSDIRRRFVREAELLFELDHPHIVKVRNVRMDADPPFIEMAFVEGASLAEHLEGGALAPGAAARLVGQIASALDHCHSRGVNHRDVKPANILVRGGHATLVDFGIAAEASGTITEGGATVGSLSYTPPEWGSSDVDAELWDAYGLGVVLFEALTGRMAFPPKPGAGLREEVIRQIDLKRGVEHLDPGGQHDSVLRTIVQQLTASNPAHRLRDLHSVSRQLADFAEGRNDTHIADIERTDSISPDTLALPGTKGTSTAAAALPSDISIQRTGSPRGGNTPPAAATMAFVEGLPSPEDEDQGNGAAPRPTLVPDSSQTHAEVQAARAEAVAQDTPAASGRSRSGLVVAIVALLLLGGAALAWIQQADQTPAPRREGTAAVGSRPVQVQTTGDALGQAVTVLLDGESVEPGTVRTVEVGAHELEARLGDGCADGSEGGCLTATREVTVVSGQGPATVGIALPEPAPITLVFEPALPDAAQVRIDDGDWTAATGLSVPAASKTRLRARVGPCPGSACRKSKSVSLTSPLQSEGPVTVAVEWPEAVSSTPKASAANPEGGLVTVAQMVRFLKRNPEWQRESVGSSAPAKYLDGWKGTTPPPTIRTQWVPQVSVALAEAICAGRGGLQPFDAPPLEWATTPGNPRDFELRKMGSGVMLRDHQGHKTSVDPSRVNSTVAVRCRR
jgi:serine/threonine protein kinase